ncbi:toxin HicA [Raoultibacter massiliensis]|uniref:Toxin HicA n=1 Tax=Raoultibacter massiliensis TaxID=1852371 RepID=A0ABV1JBN7_9ACTN|nr:toxin HicA [Raoultibacter massiliensis]
MKRADRIVESMRRNPRGVKFADAVYVCDLYFGEPRIKGTSHRVYAMPWAGDPRVNIQNDHGMAKPYQIRQVIKAIDKLSKEV